MAKTERLKGLRGKKLRKESYLSRRTVGKIKTATRCRSFCIGVLFQRNIVSCPKFYEPATIMAEVGAFSIYPPNAPHGINRWDNHCTYIYYILYTLPFFDKNQLSYKKNKEKAFLLWEKFVLLHSLNGKTPREAHSKRVLWQISITYFKEKYKIQHASLFRARQAKRHRQY